MRAIGVIGAGQMGAGIAQVSAGAGYHVYLSDLDLAKAEEGKLSPVEACSYFFSALKANENITKREILKRKILISNSFQLQQPFYLLYVQYDKKYSFPFNSSMSFLIVFNSFFRL